jgi:hypothetical protein
VGWELFEEPDRAEAAVTRLEAEFKDELGKEGLSNCLTRLPW